MYAYIYGEIIEKEPENLVIECNHIGYNIHIAPGMLAKFPAIGQMARVYTYTSVREDAFWLYGFTSKDELSLFKLLITVSGIGPKAAMGILSVMDVDTIRLAVISQDAKMIAKAPAAVLPEVLKLFSNTAAEVCEGQQYDMDFESKDWITVTAKIALEPHKLYGGRRGPVLYATEYAMTSAPKQEVATFY